MSRRLCGEWAGGYVVGGGPQDYTFISWDLGYSLFPFPVPVAWQQQHKICHCCLRIDWQVFCDVSVTALETFSTHTFWTFELFRVHIQVSVVHLFMFEHKGAFLTDVSLAVTTHHLGNCHCGLLLLLLQGLSLLKFWWWECRGNEGGGLD